MGCGIYGEGDPLPKTLDDIKRFARDIGSDDWFLQMLDELDVALQSKRRVLPHGQVVRGVEDAETHAVGHGRAPRDDGTAAARLRDERDLGEEPIT